MQVLLELSIYIINTMLNTSRIISIIVLISYKFSHLTFGIVLLHVFGRKI